MTNKLPFWSHSSQFTTQEQAVLQDAMNIIARYWATRSSDVLERVERRQLREMAKPRLAPLVAGMTLARLRCAC